MNLFPLFLDLRSRVTLVIGAGQVAEVKIAQLLECDARIRVVAPRATAVIQRWSDAGRLNWLPRAFDPRDLENVDLVFGATSSREINHLVFREARLRRVLCNIVDDPPHCDFYCGAVLRRGDLQIAVSTGGQAPALAAQLRRELEQQFGPEWADWVRKLGDIRRRVLATHTPCPERTAIIHRLASAQLGLWQQRGADGAQNAV